MLNIMLNKNSMFLVLALIVLITKPNPCHSGDSFYQDVATIFTLKDGLPNHKIKAIDIKENIPIAYTDSASYQWIQKKWLPHSTNINVSLPENLPEASGKVLASVKNAQIYAAGCENGLFLYQPKSGTWEQLFPRDNKYSWAPVNVGALTIDSKGQLWFGADQGVGYLDSLGWHLYSGKEGLPYNHFTSAAAGPDGVVWFGTQIGAIRFKDDQFSYRHSRRWLPDDHVNNLAVQKDGTVWIATDGGISRIASLPMTFEQKAEYFERQVNERHNRMGFVVHCKLKEQYNIESWKPDITDNDGAHTARYGAAQAFRYAVTGDPEAKKLAKRTFKTLKWLSDITHASGFPARTIVPVDWPEPVVEIFGHEFNERRRQNDPLWKDIYPRFVESDDGKYLWKCDTSSDELAGHFFFYGIYYDLVAETNEEKQPVKDVVSAITDHLIRNDFKLIDHDGKPTRWAKFSTDYFNTPWGWEQRGLNSMMILSFLKTAYHITNNEKYEHVARELRDQHEYHINAMNSKIYFPPESVVPWDNNLSLMSWYNLFRYEKDPELLLLYRISLENAWLHISLQRHAFWNLLYKGCADKFTTLVNSGVYNSGDIFPKGGTYSKDKALELYKPNLQINHVIETLKRIPLDLIDYGVDNRHRLDVVFDQSPGQKPNIGWRVDGTAFRIDERGDVRFNRDAYRLSPAGRGTREFEGTFYLLPYYMAKYHNVLS